jgi:hypothetical protein
MQNNEHPQAAITVEKIHERIANLKEALAFAQKGYNAACATLREKVSKCDDASLEETVDRYISDVRHYAAKVNNLAGQIELLEYIITKDAE